MRHARCFVNLTVQVQIRITGEGVCLQYAREVGKVTLWMFAAAILDSVKQHGRSCCLTG